MHRKKKGKRMVALFLMTLFLFAIITGCAAGKTSSDTVDETTQAEENRTSEAKNESTDEKDNVVSDQEVLSCTISINCETILNNTDKLERAKKDFVPSDGCILAATTVSFEAGETVHDILKRVCMDMNIHMESSYTPIYDSAYVEGIHQIYEFDCGKQSGWMYKVNGWFPNYGCSQYEVSDGDNIEWVYTCDLGEDVGETSMK